MEIERKEKLLERPRKTKDIPQWVDKHFKDRLIFHDKAKDLISETPTNEVDMDLLCDAIEFLAHEYLDERNGTISTEEMNKLSSDRYGRCFDVGLSGDKSIKTYPEEYKIWYGIGFKGKITEKLLDLHLKVGNGSSVLRIYFLFDDEKNIVVVGSLPKHLKIINKR